MPRPKVKEAVIEEYLRIQVNKRGGHAYKFVSPARRSVPDRMCVMPDGRIIFVEVKSERGILTDGQNREVKKLIALGQTVHIVRCRESVDKVLAPWS